MTRASAAQWLHEALARYDFVKRYPFYAALLSRLAVVDDHGVDWMAVSLGRTGYILHVRRDAFGKDTVSYLPGILLHELAHVALGHLSNPRFFELVDDPSLLDLCKELSANEGIEEPLPNPLRWQDFARFGVRAGQSTLERYERLRPVNREGAVRKVLRDGPGKSLDDHDRWAAGDGPSAGKLAATRTLVEQSLEEAKQEGMSPHAKIAGLSTERLLAQLGEATGPAEVSLDWRVLLQAFVHRSRVPTRTFSRPNRRFLGRVGEIPGRAWRTARAGLVSIVVAIDTSASMDESDLREVALQLRALRESARITIVECDVAVARVYPFDRTLEAVVGRGGTDLRPVFDPEFLRSFAADGVVYFTDGEGPTLALSPAIPTLWVLTDDAAFECTWGERAKFRER
ncbi:MAG: VWA-like domain-containing protein [Deltaproteobacteria bacterium]|nr:VWA-like domain-containing protein [Deltaproteobacteria bacterium]